MENTNKKMTYAIALDYVLTNCEMPDEVKEKLTVLKEKTAAKNASKSSSGESKTSKENKALAETLMAEMEVGKKYTIADLIKTAPSVNGLSNQKVTAIVKVLLADGAVQFEENKGRRYYFRTVE